MSRCLGSKISGSQQQLCSCKYGRNNKKNWHVWLSSAWLHATQESNKTVTKQDTGTTQQQKFDQTSRCGAHVLTEQWRFQRRGAAPLVLDESRGPHGWGKLIRRFGNFFKLPPAPLPPPPYLKVWIRHCSYTIISNEIERRRMTSCTSPW